MRVTAAVLVVVLGCTSGHQAAHTRSVAEKVAGGSLIVMLAAVAVQALATSVSKEAEVVAIATLPVTLAGVGTYIAADQAMGTDDARGGGPSASERANTLARDLAVAAAEAARAGDCPSVRKLERKVFDLDLDVHAMMLRYKLIRACLREDSSE